MSVGLQSEIDQFNRLVGKLKVALSGETSDEVYLTMESLVQQIRKKDVEIKSKFSENDYKFFRKNVTESTKQISNLLDNHISFLKNEMDVVKQELSLLMNRKKLATYNR